MLEEVDVLVDDIETESGQVGTRRAVTVEGFPKGEVARDVGAHVLPRGERGHVVVVLYHTYYNRKFRAVRVRTRKVILVYGMRMGSEGLGVVVIANYFTSRWIFRIITLVSLEMYLEAAITCFRRMSLGHQGD